MSIIYCDGACNSQTNSYGWGSVVDEKGKDILEDNISSINDMFTKVENLPIGKRRIIVAKFNDVNSQNNNGAELLAIIAALRIAIKKSYKIIKCDSDLIVKWWSRGHISKKNKNIDKLKEAFIKECGKLREIFETKGGQIIKISGDDNLADLGYHICK